MKASTIKFLNITGMKWGIPFIRLFSGEQVLLQLREIVKTFVAPMLAIIGFLLLWSFCASQITTSLGRLPGPEAVWEQAHSLWQEHLVERKKAKEFYARQEVRNAKKYARNPDAKISTV